MGVAHDEQRVLIGEVHHSRLGPEHGADHLPLVDRLALAGDDPVLDKIEEQLRRMLSRKREYKPGNIKKTEGDDYLAEGQESGDTDAEPDPKVIIAEKVDTKPMDIDEAVMQMELSKKNFLVFLNSKSSSINVIYKRNDGNLGLIEPVSG